MSTNIYKKNLIAAVCRTVAGDVEITSVSVSGLVETAYWPLEQKMNKNNKSEFDWTPAEEPEIVDLDALSLSDEDEDDDEVSEEFETSDEELSQSQEESVDIVQEFFGDPDVLENGEIDMENNWFHGLGVQDLRDFAEDRGLIKKLTELNSWVEELKAYSYNLRRKAKDEDGNYTGDYTPEAVAAITWGKEHGVDFLDPNTDYGVWDLAAIVFPHGLKLIRLLAAAKQGKGKLGELKIDWHSRARHQKFVQDLNPELPLQMFESDPSQDGRMNVNFNQIAWRADLRWQRELEQGVFDGIGGQPLDTVQPTLDPTDLAGKFKLMRKECISIPYLAIPVIDPDTGEFKKVLVRDEVTGEVIKEKLLYESVIQDHFLVYEKGVDDDGKETKRLVPTNALRVYYAHPVLAEVKQLQPIRRKDGKISAAYKGVKVYQPSQAQGDYSTVWEKLDAVREKRDANLELVRTLSRTTPEWAVAFKEFQKNVFWYRVMRDAYKAYVRDAGIPARNALYLEKDNGRDKNDLVVRIHYRPFTVSFIGKNAEKMAETAGVLAQYRACKEKGTEYFVRFVLYSPMSEADYTPDRAKTRKEVRDTRKQGWVTFREMKQKESNRNDKGYRLS
jgi:hypothetical protein